jgi:hypothetical protein
VPGPQPIPWDDEPGDRAIEADGEESQEDAR